MDATAVAELISSRRGTVESADLVEAQMRLAADKLRDQVALKRLAFELGEVRPLARKDLRKLVSEGASPKDVAAVVTANLGKATAIQKRLREHRKAIDAIWDEEWKSVAPGHEVLSAVTNQAGGYAKIRDGVVLARSVSPPKELCGQGLRHTSDGWLGPADSDTGQ